MSVKVIFPQTSAREVLTIHKVHSVHISASWQEMSSKAEIILPRKIAGLDATKIQKLFHRGDPVSIQLGYNDQLIEEFNGYITRVSAGIPLTIACMDEMYKLGSLPVNYSKPAATLHSLLNDIAKGYAVDALEGVSLGAVRFTAVSVRQVLEKIKQDCGLFSYMKGKQLVCGKYYADDSHVKPLHFHLEKNLVSNDLNYKDPGYLAVKIKGKSITLKGEKIEFEAGEDGGHYFELSYRSAQVLSELMRRVKEDYEKKRRGGFDGSLTAFGIPSARHGQKAVLSSDIYPERNGTYYIDAVKKSFSPAGYRQAITLGGKI